MEERDTNSLHIVEEEDVIPASMSPSMPLLLHASEDKEDSPETTCPWVQTDNEGTDGDIPPDVTAETFSDIRQTDLHTSPFAFQSGYTTMEMFQQAMPQGVPANMSVARESEPEEADRAHQRTIVKSELDYVRQFSTSPILDNEDISTIL